MSSRCFTGLCVNEATQAQPWFEQELMREPERLWHLHDVKMHWPLSSNNVIFGTWNQWWNYYRLAESKYNKCLSEGNTFYEVYVLVPSRRKNIQTCACLS